MVVACDVVRLCFCLHVNIMIIIACLRVHCLQSMSLIDAHQVSSETPAPRSIVFSMVKQDACLRVRAYKVNS